MGEPLSLPASSPIPIPAAGGPPVRLQVSLSHFPATGPLPSLLQESTFSTCSLIEVPETTVSFSQSVTSPQIYKVVTNYIWECHNIINMIKRFLISLSNFAP